MEDNGTSKEEEKKVSTEVKEETVVGTCYERVYLPETDTSEDEDSDGSNSDDDFMSWYQLNLNWFRLWFLYMSNVSSW